MKVEKIVDSDQVLAIVVRAVDWADGLSFISADDDFAQVGIWGYDRGTKLAAHTHLHAPRTVTHTQEVVHVREGALRAEIFGIDRRLVKSVELGDGDTIILLNGGHGYEILRDGTRVLEIKNGPYVGADKDRERI